MLHQYGMRMSAGQLYIEHPQMGPSQATTCRLLLGIGMDQNVIPSGSERDTANQADRRLIAASQSQL